MLYVHKHRHTSLKTMSPDAYSMLMRVFMGSMTPRGSADLRTSIHISLTREDPGGVRAPRDLHSHVWVVCRQVLHIQNSPRLEVIPRE